MASSLYETQKQLKNECEELWKELKSLQKAHNGQKIIDTTQKESSLSDIFRKKEQLLEAHLEVLKERSVHGPPSDHNTQVLMIKDALEKHGQEFEEMVVYIKDERKKAEEEVQNLTQQVSQRRQMSAVLEERINKVTKQMGNQSEAQVIEQLESDTVKYEICYKKIMKQMASFVKKHYNPQPDGQRPLLELLQLLMNKCIESPNDPYVDATVYWNPYIELFIRTGIAKRHPENDKLLKLIPLHL